MNELKPNVAADPNELKPNVDNTPAAAPPTQVNELDKGANPATATADGATASAGSETASEKEVDEAMSSSKKKKKGLRKVVPF